MHFRQSSILLFVITMSSIILGDLKEYDSDVIKEMLRTQTKCPVAYSIYVQNCTKKFESELKICDQREEASQTQLYLKSLRNVRKFDRNTDKSCDAVSDCGIGDNDYLIILSCFAARGLESATVMSNMYYEANEMIIDYNREINEISSIKESCVSNSSQELHDKITDAMTELNDCLDTGKWTKYERFEIIHQIRDEKLSQLFLKIK